MNGKRHNAHQKSDVSLERYSACCYALAKGKQSAKGTSSPQFSVSSIESLQNILLSIKMSTLFEPSLSTSAMRAPLSTADATSMADSLPPINFGFDDLRERMARFTDRFDDFIARGRKQVLEERNQFRINVAELQGNSDHSL